MIWIIGPHSSGSSCIASVLGKLGIYLGKVGRGAHSNKGGSGEDYRLARLCESWFPFPRTTTEVPFQTQCDRIMELRRQVENEGIWQNKAGPAQPSALKYPTVALLRQAVRATDPYLQVVRCRRPIEESIASLRKRFPNQGDQVEIVQRTIDQECELWEQVSGYLEVCYHELVDDPQNVVRDLVEYFGLRATRAQIEAAVAHPQARYRHEGNGVPLDPDR